MKPKKPTEQLLHIDRRRKDAVTCFNPYLGNVRNVYSLGEWLDVGEKFTHGKDPQVWLVQSVVVKGDTCTRVIVPITP